MPNVGTGQSFAKAAKKIAKAASAMKTQSATALRMIAEEIMTDVKASRPGAGVPRDTGILAGSGRVSGPFPTAQGAEVELSFGNAAAWYALIQHENLFYHHDVGEARYLVRGVERWKPGQAMQALKENYKAALAAIGRRP